MKDSKPIKMPSIYDFSARIRPMGEDDLRQVREIDLISFSTPWPERAFRYELKENPNSSSWVAEVDSHHGRRIVVGIIVIWVVQFDAHIATLAVHPDYRLKGIGSQLLGVALHNIVKQGASRVSLEVRAENNVAQKLVPKLWF